MVAAILPLASSAPAGAATAAITAQGSSLALNGVPTTIVGVNSRGLAGDPGVSAPCAQANSDQTVAATINALPVGSVLRFEVFQGGYATSPGGQLNFAGIDRVFADAASHGIYLIPVLANEWGQCDDGQQKGLGWFQSGFEQPASSALAAAEGVPTPTLSYLSYVQAFAQRYASSPALAMYEPIGEPDASQCSGQLTDDGCSAPWVCNEAQATAALTSFYSTVGATIRAADPNHLIEAGFGSNSACGLEGDDLTTVASSPGIDVLSFHDYNGTAPLTTSPAGTSELDEIGRAQALGKPIIDAETGIEASANDPGCVTPQQRSVELLHKEQAQFAAGVSGFIVWNDDPSSTTTSCTLGFSSTDPLVSALIATPPVRPGGATGPTSALAGTSQADANLAGAVLAGDDLTGVDFTGANLTGADLDGAIITGANFTGATMTGVHASHVVGTAAALPAGWSDVGGDLFGPGASLDGVDLSGYNLTGLNLAGADLSNTTLNGTTLAGVDLTSTTLENVTSSSIIGTPNLPGGWTDLGGVLVGPGANLTGVTLAAGSLSGVDLFGANLSRADLSADQLSGVASGTAVAWGGVTLPAGWTFSNGYLLGPGANLTNANLFGMNLTGINLTGATFTGANGQALAGCPTLSSGWLCAGGDLIGPGLNLAWAQLSNLDLSGVSLSGTNLTNANLSNDTLNGTNFTGANLTNVVTSGLTGSPIFPTGLGLVNGMLIAPGLPLAYDNFSGANLSGLNLTGANLTGDNLKNANLTNANLTNANLTNANLNGASTSGATLVGANLSNIVAQGLAGCPTMPSGWVCGGGVLVGPGANLAWATVKNVNLSGLNLAGTNFTGANLNGDNLSGTNLTNATLTNITSSGLSGTPILPNGDEVADGVLLSPIAQLAWINLSGANLAGVNLSGANLTGDNLTNTSLTNANLTGANLSSASLNGATLNGATLAGANLANIVALNLSGCPTMPSGWVCGGGVLVGPGANLGWATVKNVNLSGLNLAGTNFTGANLNGDNLSGTNLTNANLSTVSSSNLTGTPVLPAGDAVVNGFLFGPTAQIQWYTLTGANLSGLNLTGANLTGDNLKNANLTNTNLSNANLSSVTLTGATLTGANLTGANLTNLKAATVIGCPTLSAPWFCSGGGLVP